jgi:general secretion pathway protein G
LIEAGYIKTIPKDPFTTEANWIVDDEDSVQGVDQQEQGVVDVYSASNLTGSDGTAYSSW